MRVLVVGGGGREHALGWMLSRAAAVYCAPGNAGTAEVATNLALAADNSDRLVDAVHQHRIDLVVVGPEAPLAAGLVDRLAARQVPAFGPTAAAARIEASKAFAKDVMARAQVPTAESRSFTDQAAASRYIAGHPEPLVVKASGLAAGKGAVVCRTRAEAAAAAREMFGGKFGAAGREVLVERFLEGEELSVLALTDGEGVLLLPPAQDHKRLGEGDTGPNTGGMGAYTPVSLATKPLLDRVEQEIFLPVLRELGARGARYRGCLYAGLMISPAGDPFVVEFNCRFGDPETQVVLPALAGDLADHFWRIGSGEPWRPATPQLAAARAAVTTVVASQGYPDAPQKGAAISLPVTSPPDTLLFHAGTTRDAGGALRVAGGRVLCATGLGHDVAEAAAQSRALAEAIHYEGRVFRRDIAWREVRSSASGLQGRPS
ncbi:MAG: phosphoribosylamine--glycine ligase [Gemmatimonadetes bacterium]|nr:phosphoribosylamine--glycine ligase [Gemmatimonadota bacterium]